MGIIVTYVKELNCYASTDPEKSFETPLSIADISPEILKL
jgi:hypothetical protein